MVLSPKGVSFCQDKQRLRVLAKNVTEDTNQAFSEVRTESVVKIQFVDCFIFSKNIDSSIHMEHSVW